MIALLNALWAEALKLKRTLALWLAVLMPALIVTLQFFLIYQLGTDMFNPSEDVWPSLTTAVLGLWGVLILPLFVTLETALVANLEHSEKSWKHLFALPTPRWAIYAAKLVLNAALMALSTLVLWPGILMAGYLLSWLKPELSFASFPPPHQFILQTSFTLYAASLCLVAIHTWVSTRWASFTVASTFGIMATLIGFISLGADWLIYYPWAQAINVISTENVNLPLALSVGLLGGLVVAVLGGWDIVRRETL